PDLWALAPRPNQFRLTEEEPSFAVGVLVAVRGVNGVSLLGFSIEFLHRPFGGLLRISGADGGAKRGDGVALFEYHRHRGARGHERDEGRVERAVAMHGVEFFRLRVAQAHYARSANSES